jgi:hypothetical protein
MKSFVIFLIAFLIFEILLFFVFKILSVILIQNNGEKSNTYDPDPDLMEAIKGFLERFTLTLGLLLGFPQILIFFGALKVGVRIQTMLSCPQYNNFILFGNLITVSSAILYTFILQNRELFLAFFVCL